MYVPSTLRKNPIPEALAPGTFLKGVHRRALITFTLEPLYVPGPTLHSLSARV